MTENLTVGMPDESHSIAVGSQALKRTARTMPTPPRLVELNDDPGFRRYVGADPDRVRIVECGSDEELDSLANAFPAYKEAERAHAVAIATAHPNFVELYQEPGFADFVVLVGAQAVVDHGDATEINTLLTAYVAYKNAPVQRKKTSRLHRARAVLTSREERALRALLSGPHRREQLDRAAGASNGPDLIKNMRSGLGLALPCDMVASLDRDGRRVKVGEYSLSISDRPKVLGLMAQEGPRSTLNIEADGDTWVDWIKTIPQRALASLILSPLPDREDLTDDMRGNQFFAAALPA